MSEITCEARELCNNNEILFKGIFAQDLALVSTVAPYTASEILPLLQSSATAAAKSCTGGGSNNRCGVRWYAGEWDGWKGMEEDISAAALFTSNLVAFKQEPVATETTSSNGTGTSGGSVSGTGTGSGAAAATTTGANCANALSTGPLVLAAAMVAGIFALP